jgi:hypothetical protein
MYILWTNDLVNALEVVHVDDTTTSDKNDCGVIGTQFHGIDGILQELLDPQSCFGDSIAWNMLDTRRVTNLCFTGGHHNI